MTFSPGFALGQVAIAQAEPVSLEIKSKIGVATVVIKTVDMEENAVLISNQYSKPLFKIIQLNISVNGQAIFVPRSVFADLINPHEASIKFKKDQFILSIYGADGADSYFLHIYFDKEKINRRSVYSSLIPDKPTQETYYWLHVLKDE
jgi:hypothetical protein